MRYLRLLFAAVLMVAVSASAQTPTTGDPKGDPKADPAKEKAAVYLDAYLNAWEKRMQGLRGLETKVTLIEKDGKDITTYEGDAAILRPNLCKVFLVDKDNPKDAKRWKHFVADGKFLWEYNYASKVVYVHALPKDGIADNTLMTFLFGMKSKEIKGRYELSMEPDNKRKMTEWYAHIGILPKSDADKQEFKLAELVLIHNRDEKVRDLMMLPARLWFQNTNGNEITWEFKEMKTKIELDAKAFEAPKVPANWKSEWGTPPKPTVTRGTGYPKAKQ
jgi:TIGR03009 family protein